ncbi:hypothetical protein DPMN_192679 [Dreissena polymorpha]|uniref:Uncharacterized protein n=1 Tax=Dreissena polymorpha TaxID=45954 RepID=A0A9D4BFC2_DREPO|nr:hypothetical protein DPMN_192679 [Dreissena polymorpha]
MARQRPTRLVMGPCTVEIDRFVISEVQYQLEVNQLKGNFGWVWPMWAGLSRVGNWAMHIDIYRIVRRIVQYQLEVNRKRQFCVGVAYFGWGTPGLVIGPCIVDIDLNRLKGNFGWVWPMWVGRLRVGNGAMHIEIDRIVIREFQYQFEVNRCRNEEIKVKRNFGWVWSMWAGCPRIDRIVIREVQYQFEVNQCRNKEVNDGQTDGRTDRRTDGRRR